MKKLTILFACLLVGIMTIQAQKLVLEKANPSFGPYVDGETPEVVMRFKNSDAKTVTITRYYPRWMDEKESENRAKNGPQSVITIAPGKIWELRFRIPTDAFGVGKHTEYYILYSNATNLKGDEIPFSFEITKRPYTEPEEGEGRRGRGYK